MTETAQEFAQGLDAALARHGMNKAENLARLHGGAMMESWRFSSGDQALVLRRAPSAEMMADRPFGHDVEAAIIRAAEAAGVIAPKIVFELSPEDDLGTGFVMEALPGTAAPKTILVCDDPSALLDQCARQLAGVHAIPPEALPEGLPLHTYGEMIDDLTRQFREAGGDRPVIALGLRWLRDNTPPPIEPVLNHGDFRMGNLLVEGSKLTGVLDWEMAHLGDRHEDLAYACMTVWRFDRIDRPALGLGPIEDWFAAYEAAGGQTVDWSRVRFWLVFRTVWWALGCLGMARTWRGGADRTLERAVISRRASEQELDLLLLLEEDAPGEELCRPVTLPAEKPERAGEASIGELAIAIAEWLDGLKTKVEGHDRFQLAVARNALGMIARDDASDAATAVYAPALADDILQGRRSLASPGLLAELRADVLAKLGADVPKYPALATARHKWTGDD